MEADSASASCSVLSFSVASGTGYARPSKTQWLSGTTLPRIPPHLHSTLRKLSPEADVQMCLKHLCESMGRTHNVVVSHT